MRVPPAAGPERRPAVAVGGGASPARGAKASSGRGNRQRAAASCRRRRPRSRAIAWTAEPAVAWRGQPPGGTAPRCPRRRLKSRGVPPEVRREVTASLAGEPWSRSRGVARLKQPPEDHHRRPTPSPAAEPRRRLAEAAARRVPRASPATGPVHRPDEAAARGATHDVGAAGRGAGVTLGRGGRPRTVARCQLRRQGAEASPHRRSRPKSASRVAAHGAYASPRRGSRPKSVTRCLRCWPRGRSTAGPSRPPKDRRPMPGPPATDPRRRLAEAAARRVPGASPATEPRRRLAEAAA